MSLLLGRGSILPSRVLLAISIVLLSHCSLSAERLRQCASRQLIQMMEATQQHFPTRFNPYYYQHTQYYLAAMVLLLICVPSAASGVFLTRKVQEVIIVLNVLALSAYHLDPLLVSLLVAFAALVKLSIDRVRVSLTLLCLLIMDCLVHFDPLYTEFSTTSLCLDSTVVECDSLEGCWHWMIGVILVVLLLLVTTSNGGLSVAIGPQMPPPGRGGGIMDVDVGGENPSWTLKVEIGGTRGIKKDLVKILISPAMLDTMLAECILQAIQNGSDAVGLSPADTQKHFPPLVSAYRKSDSLCISFSALIALRDEESVFTIAKPRHWWRHFHFLKLLWREIALGLVLFLSIISALWLTKDRLSMMGGCGVPSQSPTL
jgi:hypothetical protein